MSAITHLLYHLIMQDKSMSLLLTSKNIRGIKVDIVNHMLE